MAKQLFPKAFITTSIEHYTFRIRSRSRAIYLTVLLGICASIATLPLIDIEVATTAQGAVGTQRANFVLHAPVTAPLTLYQLKESRHIYQGDTLAVFDTGIFHQEITQIEDRTAELDAYRTDLGLLIADTSTDTLKTATYQLTQAQYSSGLQRLIVRRNGASKIYKRQQKLYRHQVIPATELQRDREALDLAKAEVVFFNKQALKSC